MKNTRGFVLVWAAFAAFNFAAFSSVAFAESFSDKCREIASCAKVVSELTGQKYVFDEDIKGKMQATPNVELTRENAEVLFTNMLNANGFSRVPVGEAGSWQIMRQRDARDAAVPLLLADREKGPEFSRNWDIMTLRYRATNPDSVEYIARTCRSFMPAMSRVIPEELSGSLLVTDTAPNLKKIYEIIKDLDRKPTADQKKHWEEQKRRFEEERKNKPPHSAPAPTSTP